MRLPDPITTSPAAFLIAVVLASASLVGLATREAAATTIDPCYGYDLCVHVQVAPFDQSDGSGLITSSPSGIDCHYSNGFPDTNAVCDHYFHTNFATSITVSIHAVADAGSVVACGTYLPNNSSCDASETYTTSTYDEFYVTFRLHPTVSVAATGAGVVLSSPAGIQCTSIGGVCSDAWVSQTIVTLTASAATDFTFIGWQGFCSGQGSTCSFTLDADVDSTAVFQSTAPPPTPKPTGTPGPTMTPRPTASQLGGYPTPAPYSSTGGITVSGRSSPPGVSLPTPANSGNPSATSSSEEVSPGTIGSGAPVAAAESLGPVDAGGAGAVSTSGGRDAPTDLTPVLFAVLGAGVLVALSILAVGVMLRRRRDGPAA